MDSKEKRFRQRTNEEGEGDDIEVELDPIDGNDGKMLLLYSVHTDNCLYSALHFPHHVVGVFRNYLIE